MLTAFSRHPLVRDLAIVLTVKIVIIALASVYLLSAHRSPAIGPKDVAQKLFGSKDNAAE